MTSPRARFPWLRASGFGAVALALVAVACETPGPVQVSPTASGTRMEPVHTTLTTTTATRPSGVRVSRAAIDAAVREHYPEVFTAAATDTATLLFVLAPTGEVERHEKVKLRRMGSAPATVQEAQARWRETSRLSNEEMGRSMVDVVTFSPGQVGPGQVEVLWVRTLAPGDLTTTVDVDTQRVSGPLRMRMPGPGAGPAQEGEITAEQARGYVQRYMPQVARDGTTAEFVWFMADASGAIVQHGDARTSEAINSRVNDLGNVQAFKGTSVVVNGHEIPVIYARLKA